MQSLVKLLNVRKKEKYEISLGEKVNQRVSVYGLDPLPSTFPPSPLPFPFVSFLSPSFRCSPSPPFPFLPLFSVLSLSSPAFQPFLSISFLPYLRPLPSPFHGCFHCIV